jgi:hypothetical protein
MRITLPLSDVGVEAATNLDFRPQSRVSAY